MQSMSDLGKGHVSTLLTKDKEKVDGAGSNRRRLEVGVSFGLAQICGGDDVMCFCRPRPSKLAAVKWCIETFSRWSGLKVNEKKSGLFWSKNFRQNKKMAFEVLRQKVLGGNLNGWRSKLLSSAGRGTLIKSVVSSMPFYGMSTFLIPKEICKEMDRMVGKIWWRGEVAEGRCWCPRSCDSVCQPKVFGGLGFRRFHDINCALVAKLGWKLQVDGNSLWIKALRLNISTLQILSIVVPLLLVGVGSLARIWEAPWVPWLEEGLPQNETAAREDISVADLWDLGTNSWKLSVLQELFEEDSVRKILRIHWMGLVDRDVGIWTGAKDGIWFGSPLGIRKEYWQGMGIKDIILMIVRPTEYVFWCFYIIFFCGVPSFLMLYGRQEMILFTVLCVNVLKAIGFYGPPVSPEVAEAAAVIKSVEAAIQEGWWKNV
ncbi:hypothetical protein TIFTF001_028053 [Ficus carica]|uniref:Uncharacterized protein n=1 Tax=Ficus carica TaxID=3494 RepID=A0AA88J147_FICCA|nr:hypothetical protein TIFTF001_028053 [Ficus carica]